MLPFQADHASPGVAHFDFETVLRVRECRALSLLHFEAREAERAVELSGGFVKLGLAGFAVFGDVGASPVRQELLAQSAAGVFQTHVLQCGHGVAFFALQALVAGLSGAVRDDGRRAQRAVGGDVLRGRDGDPGRTADLVLHALARLGVVCEALEAWFVAADRALVPLDVFAVRFLGVLLFLLLFLLDIFLLEFAGEFARQFVA